MKNGKFVGLKNNTFAAALIILGVLIFYWTKDYKEVPSGIGPAFFPRIVATLLIVLSAINYLMPDKKQETESSGEKTAVGKIVFTTVSLLLMVAVMKYIHPVLGIFLFLAAYLKKIAELDLKKTIIITAIGTGILYVAILALRIPM